jgi:MoxR-like ATPase
MQDQAEQMDSAAKPSAAAESDLKAAESLKDSYERINSAIHRVIIGQEEVLEQLLISILARGHCLLVGVPGLAKTLLVSSLAQAISLSFKRIQFTPDLMPSDITGTEVIQDDPTTGERRFKFLKGPVFANVLLADEINRTPPKTQAALLEAMQERQVSVGGEKYPVPDPFFVLATQNPIEQEGTYPLPEAQLDRFLFMVLVDYPTVTEEIEIMKRMTAGPPPQPEVVLTGEEILRCQEVVRRVPVADQIFAYAADLVRRTRPREPEVPDYVREGVTWGAGPRASMNLIAAGKVRALLHGRFHVNWDDIRAVAKPVLRHRIILSFAAQAEGMTPDMLVERLLEEIPVRKMREVVV